MNYAKSNIDSSIDNNKIEIIENKALLYLRNFWKFSLFYGDYLANLHSRKNADHRKAS